MRKKHREDFQKKHNLKLGFMSAFIKAAAHGLSTMPEVNAGRFTRLGDDFTKILVIPG